ncbi:unnamed protein product [Closterium sp. Yama58-4]|nr:unnamed protein product [Closterium sp. Yama58-4]
MIHGSGHENLDGEKGSDGGEMRDGASNMRRAATDLPRTKSPYTRRSAYLTARQRAAVASRFYNELKRNTLVGEDYKVQIHTDNFPRELQEEFLHMFAQPQDQAGREGEIIAPRAAESVGKLNICILIVGTRGDVQPFIAIGQKLKSYGHRVRLASHSNYRDFVIAGGLEFYPLGGDPKVLAEYMVKNKGFLPSSRAEVLQQRKQLKSIIFSTWPACTQPDLASNGAPFRADAIIANPPVYGHTTVAEALQVPLHMFFTMPWRHTIILKHPPTHPSCHSVPHPLFPDCTGSMTTEYPHPLAGEMPAYTGYENQLSYVVVEGLMWLGVRDFINSFRKKLKLPPIPLRNRPKMRIPFGYIWSPTLAPKPHDWGNLIDVVGFCFLNLADHYSAPAHIQQWLDSGPAPVFIGFGSLPVSDPKGLTQKFVEALQRTGQRGILQEGWGGLGKMETPNENLLVIGNCPHDWLFPRCRAVIHHGGAGTTAAGLKAACPTTVIPFFGDQPFWGARVHAAGVGPEPIPIGSLTLDKIVAAIEFMIRDEVVAAAKELAGKIAKEDGVDGAVEAFHKHLPPGYHTQEHCTPWLEASPGEAVAGGLPWCGPRLGLYLLDVELRGGDAVKWKKRTKELTKIWELVRG